MSNERIDEFLSWRGRVDDPRGVPGQGLDDREATWERLMDKIAGKPRRRGFFGYRVAVAFVLLALVPALGLFYDRHSRVVAVRPIERQRIVAKGALMRSPGSLMRSPGATNKNVAAARVKPAKPGRQKLKQQPVQIARLATPSAVLASKIPDSTDAVALKPLKNKPLRVVSINELPGGPGPLPAVAAYDPGRPFKIFLSPEQSRMALPPRPPAAEAALLKVRLSSSSN